VSEVTIREAGLTDVAELSALAQRTWSDAFGEAFSPEDASADAEARRSEAFFAAALSDSRVLVAERDGQMVGYAKFGPVAIAEANAGPGDRELHRLYVERSLHRNGIGAALLAAALEHPELAGASRVFLNVWEDNAPAVALYRRFGFVKVGVNPYWVGTQRLEDAVMMRPHTGTPSSR
jgi:ribosomal protein S18 acetylase RimI-like enzyme